MSRVIPYRFRRSGLGSRGETATEPDFSNTRVYLERTRMLVKSFEPCASYREPKKFLTQTLPRPDKIIQYPKMCKTCTYWCKSTETRLAKFCRVYCLHACEPYRARCRPSIRGMLYEVLSAKIAGNWAGFARCGHHGDRRISRKASTISPCSAFPTCLRLFRRLVVSAERFQRSNPLTFHLRFRKRRLQLHHQNTR